MAGRLLRAGLFGTCEGAPAAERGVVELQFWEKDLGLSGTIF